MAQSDTPFGFVPVGHLLGLPYTGKERMYRVAAAYGTAIFRGDLLKLGGSSDANGIPTVEVAAVGTPILGAVVSIIPNRDNLSQKYIPATTGGYVLVADDPYIIFEAQEDDADGTTLAQADIGLNCDFVAGSGSTLTGVSAYEIDRSTKGAGSDIGLKLLRLSQRQGNAFGAYSKYEVLINEHCYKAPTAGA